MTTPDFDPKMHIFYQKQHDGNNRLYIVQDGYNHSVSRVLGTLTYCRQMSIVVPDEKEINVEVLQGPRFKRMMSVEFSTPSEIPFGTELTPDSGLWNWLVY